MDTEISRHTISQDVIALCASDLPEMKEHIQHQLMQRGLDMLFAEEAEFKAINESLLDGLPPMTGYLKPVPTIVKQRPDRGFQGYMKRANRRRY